MPLIIIHDGTKCDICGSSLNGRAMQSVKCTCESCGASYVSCGKHLCPDCGGILLDQYEIFKKEYGSEVFF